MLLSRLKIQKKQKLGLKKVSGHNNLGRVTVKGKKKHHRTSKIFIDWTNSLKDSFLVGIHHNSLHQGMLYKFFNVKTKSFFFFPAISDYSFLSTAISNKLKLKDFNIGDFCNNIGIKKSIYVKAPGTYAKVLQRYTFIKNYMLLELPSGEHKLFLKDNFALKGSLLGFSNTYENVKKAGRNRWLGKRPKVRGVAMNPIDHPHGGGEGKTSGGRPSVSPKGRLTKNVPTRSKKKKNNWQVLKRC